MGKARVRRHLDELIPEPGAPRRLAFLTLVQAVGTGLFLTSSAIFFTRTIGFSPRSVALVLSIAGLSGFLSTVPVGKLADRWGARPLLAGNYAVLAVLFSMYCLSTTIPVFAVVACLIAIGETSGSPLRSTLTYALFGREDAVKVRSQTRGIFNLGSMSGAALAAVALTIGTREAFYAVMLTNAAAQLTCAFITLSLRTPREAPERAASSTPVAAGGPRQALGDHRFLAITFANGLLEMHSAMLSIGIPLWTTTHLHQPGGLVSAVMIVNTLFVILFQVRLSRGADTTHGAAALLRRGGILLGVSCALFSLTALGPSAWVITLVIVAAAVMVTGEIYQSAGSWGVSFELPPPGRQGEYQGVFALGRGLQQFLGPFLVTSLVIGVGSLGWLILTAMFVLVGTLCVPLVRSAAKNKADEELYATG